MSTQPALPAAANLPRTSSDAALRAAWKRHMEYSDASTRRKRTHSRVRLATIVLSLAASVLAVTITYQDTVPQIAQISEGMRILLVVLPLVVAGTLTYAFQFMPSTSWVAYRVGSELIRHQIYLYRMQAGDYASKLQLGQQQLLIDRIAEADAKVAEIGAPEPYIEKMSTDFAAQIKARTDTPNDDGFSQLTADEYIQFRLIPQRDWYINRMHEDYRRLRIWRAIVLIAAGSSSLLVVIGQAPLVAVATALGLSIGMYIDLKMYGRTYALYHLAAEKLENEINRWSILPAEQKKLAARTAEFVTRVEEIFNEERYRWMQQAIQAQMASEQALMRNINLANSPFKFEDTLTATARTTVTTTETTTAETTVSASAAGAPADENGDGQEFTLYSIMERMSASSASQPQPSNVTDMPLINEEPAVTDRAARAVRQEIRRVNR